MTQWEQLKTEYKNIPVPVNSQAKMLAAMEEARQKRSRHRKYVQYGSLVAAAMLVLLLMPANMFRMGNKAAAPESALQNNGGMMFDTVTGESAVEEGWFVGNTTAADSMAVPEEDMSVAETPKEESVEVMEKPAAGVTQEASSARVIFSAEELEAIGREIAKQMQESKEERDFEYSYNCSYDVGEYVVIDNSVNYYISEEGLYVIVFEAGEIAPEEQGKMEFVIPAEVVSP